VEILDNASPFQERNYQVPELLSAPRRFIHMDKSELGRAIDAPLQRLGRIQAGRRPDQNDRDGGQQRVTGSPSRADRAVRQKASSEGASESASASVGTSDADFFMQVVLRKVVRQIKRSSVSVGASRYY
jgi:hypothetical protein